MEKFSLGEQYRLELHWSKAKYEKDGVCELEGVYFSGPALQIAEKINNNDSIKIDFHSQYLIFTTNVYVATLSWGEVVYNKDNTITLKDAKLTHDSFLNVVPKLKNGDYLVIDTENHEAAVHRFNLVYISYIINENGVLYKF